MANPYPGASPIDGLAFKLYRCAVGPPKSASPYLNPERTEERHRTMPNRLQQLFGERSVLCDGAMGTILYDHGIFINRCYDELNLTTPDLVRSIHDEYLQAGAELIETNTFGANRFRLKRFGLDGKVAEINQAGVRLAREAVAQLNEKQAAKA